MSKHIGSCSCGEVEYSFEGDPINAVFCYCSECQKLTGSDKWFGVWVPTGKFQFTKGEPSVFTRIGDSGKEMNQHFCSKCATTLCTEVTIGNFYSVSGSSLSAESSFLPKMAIYTASAPSWAVLPEDIPKFDILPPGLGG